MASACPGGFSVQGSFARLQSRAKLGLSRQAFSSEIRTSYPQAKSSRSNLKRSLQLAVHSSARRVDRSIARNRALKLRNEDLLKAVSCFSLVASGARVKITPFCDVKYWAIVKAIEREAVKRNVAPPVALKQVSEDRRAAVLFARLNNEHFVYWVDHSTHVEVLLFPGPCR